MSNINKIKLEFGLLKWKLENSFRLLLIRLIIPYKIIKVIFLSQKLIRSTKTFLTREKTGYESTPRCEGKFFIRFQVHSSIGKWASVEKVIEKDCENLNEAIDWLYKSLSKN